MRKINEEIYKIDQTIAHLWENNSDMSLMNRLAFWCNGDKEQMLRIFATSGLYRPEKSDGYYEGTAIKAVKDVTSLYNVQQNKSPRPTRVNGSGKGGK